MCIAITSPKNNPIPTDDILKTCFRNNSDGAGFAFNTDNNQVKIVKGFMDYDSFITALHEYDKKYNLTDRGVLIHCRIGTSGKKTKGGYCVRSCTHPFPISSKDKHLKKLDCTSNFAVIHNGIINLTADGKSELSDTMLFIKNFLKDISSNPGWFYNPQNMNLIYNLIESKMAILNGNGDIVCTDGFHKADDGNYYSNYSYKERDYGIYSYGFFDDDWYGAYYKNVAEEQYEMPLMELKPGESIYYDDGCVEEYRSDYHNVVKTYVNEACEVYGLFDDEEYDDKIPVECLSYIGNGQIVDNFFCVGANGIKVANFRKDAVAIL